MAHDYDTATRRRMLAEGHALPPLHEGGEPRYPIGDCEDVQAALHDLGRTAEGDRDEVRRYIERRAKELGCSATEDHGDSHGSERDQSPEREHRWWR